MSGFLLGAAVDTKSDRRARTLLVVGRSTAYSPSPTSPAVSSATRIKLSHERQIRFWIGCVIRSVVAGGALYESPESPIPWTATVARVCVPGSTRDL